MDIEREISRGRLSGRVDAETLPHVPLFQRLSEDDV